MENLYPHLTSPIRIGKVLFRNRMFSAPVGGAEITKDCCIDRTTTAFYELRAKGGAAAVTASECMVDPETDASHAFHLNTTTPGSLAGFAHTADAIARHGAVPSLELSHSGQYAGTYLTDKKKKGSLAQYGPIDTTRPDGRPVKALTEEQLESIIKAYGNAAALAKRVGFRMVMVHAGHGWLLNQFLSPFFNKRTDDYGGSLENRVRLTMRVLDAIRAEVGPGFPIELRMSGSEFFEGGYDLTGGVEIAQMLEDKVDLFHITAGSYQRGFSITHPSQFREHGCNVFLAEEIKKHVNKPVATLGGLNDPAQMEEIIASGKADVVEMARALMADPFLPRKATEGRADDIVPCLRCFVCMSERPLTATRRCAVNPVIGREADGVEVALACEADRKKVMVVGGGPAGLKAACVAAQRGHDVVLFEAQDELGGLTLTEKETSFKKEMYDLGVVLAKQARDAGVDIRTSTPVTPEAAKGFGADAIIVAAGSRPFVPDMPGVDGENVLIVNDYYKDPDAVGDTVVVAGAGLSGTELAIELAMKGKKVTLVDALPDIARDANIRQRPILLEQIAELGIETHVNCFAKSVDEAGLVCAIDGEDVRLDADTVVLAFGQRANSEVFEQLVGCAPWVVPIGDCAHVGNITSAMSEAFHVAQDI